MKKSAPIIIAVVVLVALGVFFFLSKRGSSTPTPVAAEPTEEPVQVLEADKQPKVSLSFKADGHYVTVYIANLHAGAVEYNLIYDAKIKRNGITSDLNTGVTGSAKVSGQPTYTKDELLGSESSGHLTFHENIKNAVLELTLRDDAGRSIFTSSYPFTVTAGKSVDLTPNQ